MKNNFKNNFGFTLLEMMIAAGIGSVVVLFAVTQLKSSRQVIGTSIVSNETSFLQNLVIANMSNPLACEKTFGTFPLVRSNFSLKNKAGNDFLTTNQEVTTDNLGAKKIFKVTSISSKADPKSDKNLILTIQYEINTNLERVSKKALNSFDVDVYVKSAGGNVTSCFFDSAAMIKKAVYASCQGNAAKYNPGSGLYGTCTHQVALNGTTAVGKNLCPPNHFLKETKSINAGIINFECAPFSTDTPTCPAGQYLNGIDNDGKAICYNVLDAFPVDGTKKAMAVVGGVYMLIDLECPTDMVLQKIYPKICVPKVITGSCPTGQYISSVSATGVVGCSSFTKKTGACPTGTYLTGVNSDGSGQVCSPLTLPASCPAGRVLTAVDSNGNASWCQNVTN